MIRDMKVFIPLEQSSESRVAITPDFVKKFKNLGMDIFIESGAGNLSNFSDENYSNCGATIVNNDKRNEHLADADIILHVLPIAIEDVSKLKSGCWHISFLDNYKYGEHISEFKKHGVAAISLEKIPRTSLAQKMDALSSQASLAGYSAVLKAASNSKVVFPMMVTPAGTLQAAKFFVIGAGVAGLQAIATAKRLGARIEAFDTRPEVEDQIKSLGAKFLKIDLGETASTTQGYAKALTEEQLATQRKLMADACIKADVVITTAKVFGRKAPIIITQDTIGKMKHGSVIVDLAVDTGGNTEIGRAHV